MLRISIVPNATHVALKLEGKLLEPWHDELLDACQRAADHQLPVQLDLLDVTFIDADGASLVRSLLTRGFTLVRCSNFVAELLDTEHV